MCVAGLDAIRQRTSSAVWALAWLAGLLSAGCATHRAASVTPSADSLSSYVAKIRALAAEARPPKNSAAQTVETWDGPLAAALADLALNPTSAAAHRQVATEYRRLGVLDSAHAQFTAALRVDPRDAGAYDGRARLWRDFGFPDAGLGDAYRAVYFAPGSAAAVNTLGTLFEAMGRLADARAQYARARELDPAASFATTNLCHIETMLGRRDAVAGCQQALGAAPKSAVARNNLALAYAVAGDFARAREEFSAGGDVATAAYNMGIVYMASRQFEEATVAFRSAWQARPGFVLAGQRLIQAGAARAQQGAP